MKKSGLILGRVEYVEGSSSFPLPDDADAWRIKVRLDDDGDVDVASLPWAFPLNPKVIQSIPQVGEGVFVITSEIGNNGSQRFYSGPIISQPQYQAFCDYGIDGRGPATSLLTNGKPYGVNTLASISKRKDLTYGSFPNIKDIAILGRGQEDVVLKYRKKENNIESEIDMRAGIRLEPSDDSIKYLKGNVVFNNVNPSYIQIKHGTNGICGIKKGTGDSYDSKYESPSKRSGNGVVNIVADKINLISHKDTNGFGEKIADRENLVREGELDDIMSLLHRSVYGDELIILLKKIVNVLATHTHPYNMLPPTVEGTELKSLVEYPYENIISPNVRIS